MRLAFGSRKRELIQDWSNLSLQMSPCGIRPEVAAR